VRPGGSAAASAGFLLAGATLIFAAGLPAVRNFLTHGVAMTRLIDVIFILFGARSIADAAGGAMRRSAQASTPPEAEARAQRPSC
jgi:hypothetical protein